MKDTAMSVETYCDCNHRRSVHLAARVLDIHDQPASFRSACALVGCECQWFTQEAQRQAAEARGTARLLADLGMSGHGDGVSAAW
jgi:hypothetical protein